MINELVVCINNINDPDGTIDVPSFLTKGLVYTIIDNRTFVDFSTGEMFIGLKLFEIESNIYWNSKRFRPISKPDISSLKAFLTNPETNIIEQGSDLDKIRRIKEPELPETSNLEEG
jgi:hypothetical protein